MNRVQVTSGLVTAGVVGLLLAFAPVAHGQRAAGPDREARRLSVLGRGAELGVSVRDVEPSASGEGVVVEDVRSDSPAAKAGVKASDVIVAFDGERVRSARQFSRLVAETPPGRTVTATIVRDGRKSDVRLTAEERRAEVWFDGDRLRDQLGDLSDRMSNFNFDFQMAPPLFGARGRLGVTVERLTPQLAEYFGAPGGVLVASVSENTPASRAGVRPGDVVTAANGQALQTREDFARIVRETKAGTPLTLTIVRDKKETSITVSDLR